jgi:hypothetical protein
MCCVKQRIAQTRGRIDQINVNAKLLQCRVLQVCTARNTILSRERSHDDDTVEFACARSAGDPVTDNLGRAGKVMVRYSALQAACEAACWGVPACLC